MSCKHSTPPDALVGEAPSAAEALPLFSPRIGLGILPIVVYWSMRRVAETQLAVAAAVAMALLVFATNRHRGAIGLLALMAVVVVAGGGAVGIILDSDKAFLANDVVGDFLTVGVALGSVLYGRPLFGLMARELSPRLQHVLAERARVFVVLTLVWALANAATGSVRIVLLDQLSASEYVLWSRVVSVPLNAAVLALGFVLIARAAEEALRDPAAPP